jgi:uncharacterized membrane protein HdeD (DUF308 family)
MEWVIIIFGLLYIIFTFWNCSTNDKDQKLASTCLSAVSAIIVFAAYLSCENRNTPTAIDVYQGKTTLEITYKDSIRSDSIVVFKDEFKKTMEE